MNPETIERVTLAIARGLQAFGITVERSLANGAAAPTTPELQEALAPEPQAPSMTTATAPPPQPPPAAAPPPPAESTTTATTAPETLAAEQTPEPATGVLVTAEQLGEMSRAQMVRFITDNDLSKIEAFSLPPIEGKLKGRRETTIRDWLTDNVAGRTADELSGSSTQVAPPAAAPPPASKQAPPANEPDEHPDVAADPQLKGKAEAMMQEFAAWGASTEPAAPGQPSHAELLQQFFAERSCNGNCLLHNRANIEDCWSTLNDDE